jgi:prepilin-type processing-associated H-X9-DG protein
MLQHESTLKRFPAGHYAGGDAGSAASAFVPICAYLEEGPAFDTVRDTWSASSASVSVGLWQQVPDYTNWYNNPLNKQFVLTRPKVFICPSSNSEPTTTWGSATDMLGATGDYAPCNGSAKPTGTATTAPYGGASWAKSRADGMFRFATQRQVKEITDGTSKTLEVGEVEMASVQDGYNMWSYAERLSSCMRTTFNPINTPLGFGDTLTTGGNSRKQNACFGSEHPGGAQFVFVDGHVVFLPEDVDYAVYRNASTIAGPPAGEADAAVTL